MDWTLIIVFQVLFQPSLSVLFTVEAERTVYNSEIGQDVVMGCRFQPKPSKSDSKLKVSWLLPNSGHGQNVYQYSLDNSQGPSIPEEYQGRVKLLTNELQEGWAKLQISNLRINDSRTYQCLVQTSEGADYKEIALVVTAPYNKVTKTTERAAEGNKVLLTCQSEGYPETSVVWRDGNLTTISSNTSSVTTPEDLVKVTSQILVSSSDKNNYTCHFTNDGHSATFNIPEEIPAEHMKQDALIVLMSIGVVLAVVTVAVLLYRRQKGFRTLSKRNLLVEGRVRAVTADACPQTNKENEEEKTVFSEAHQQENLRAYLKELYCEIQSAVDAEELRHRLQNNEGRPVSLQALIPEAGETTFLEGQPGSGKTSVAYVLVSSWTAGPTRALLNFLDLSALQLLLYVDCSKTKGDLLQEIMTQLSLKENISTENELRTMLSRSNETLLLLDGYREGNAYFDDSLKRFLSEKGECRVLVMTCQEHCHLLEETARTTRVLKLQTQIVKY